MKRPVPSSTPRGEFGKFSQSMITAIPADLDSPVAKHFRNTIPRFPDEAVYIYSFKENKMIYAEGWERILGYKDDEISMLSIVTMSASQFAPFSNELNDKALEFILSQDNHLKEYSFSIELKKIHKDGSEVPIVARVGVYEVENGRVTAIIGNFRKDTNLNFGNVMRYTAYGPAKAEFEKELNKSLFKLLKVSKKGKEALEMAANGDSFKEIADKLKVSPSAIEKRINSMYKRFGLKNIAHLVKFAFDNHILP